MKPDIKIRCNCCGNVLLLIKSICWSEIPNSEISCPECGFDIPIPKI